MIDPKLLLCIIDAHLRFGPAIILVFSKGGAHPTYEGLLRWRSRLSVSYLHGRKTWLSVIIIMLLKTIRTIGTSSLENSPFSVSANYL